MHPKRKRMWSKGRSDCMWSGRLILTKWVVLGNLLLLTSVLNSERFWPADMEGGRMGWFIFATTKEAPPGLSNNWNSCIQTWRKNQKLVSPDSCLYLKWFLSEILHIKMPSFSNVRQDKKNNYLRMCYLSVLQKAVELDVKSLVSSLCLKLVCNYTEAGISFSGNC